MSSYREPTIRGDDEPTGVEDRALRPTRMADMVGQRDVYERLMIAKLRRRMPKFALLVARDTPSAAAAGDVLAETFEVLRSLGHSDTDARRLCDTLRGEKKKVKDVQEALEIIYRSMHKPR